MLRVITIEYTHEVNGHPKFETIDIARPIRNRKAYTEEPFGNHVRHMLEQSGAVKPRIVAIDYHHTIDRH